MKRLIIIALTLIVIGAAAYVLDQYWIHRFDSLIAAEASRYHVDPDLVWSIAYEESYFAPWKNGKAGEIGMMQVTPGVLQDWAAENAGTAVQQRSTTDPSTML